MPGPSSNPADHQQDRAVQGKGVEWVITCDGMRLTFGYVKAGTVGWVTPLGPAPYPGLADILKAQHGV